MTVMRKTYLARVIALLLLVELLGSCATPLTEQKQSNQLSSQADSKDFDIMLANAQLQNHAALRRFEDSLAKLEANYAQRFDSAANTVAVTHMDEADITDLVKVREKEKAKAAKKTKKTKPRKIKKRVKQKKSSKKRPKLLKRLRKFRF